MKTRVLREKDLFPPLKKHFKEQGYSVFAEVPCFYRGVDFVAAKESDHVAVEMKMSFSWEVIRQAHGNVISFGKSYIAFPVKKHFLVHDANFWELDKKKQDKVDHCMKRGIGILQVLPHGTIFEALEARYEKPYRIFDFSQFKESDEDEAGLPCQKGVSAGYYELEAIKAYVTKNPNAKWKEIFENVQNHYSSHTSMAGSMKSWRGFSLGDFKKSLQPEKVYESPQSLF